MTPDPNPSEVAPRASPVERPPAVPSADQENIRPFEQYKPAIDTLTDFKNKVHLGFESEEKAPLFLEDLRDQSAKHADYLGEQGSLDEAIIMLEQGHPQQAETLLKAYYGEAVMRETVLAQIAQHEKGTDPAHPEQQSLNQTEQLEEQAEAREDEQEAHDAITIHKQALETAMKSIGIGDEALQEIQQSYEGKSAETLLKEYAGIQKTLGREWWSTAVSNESRLQQLSKRIVHLDEQIRLIEQHESSLQNPESSSTSAAESNSSDPSETQANDEKKASDQDKKLQLTPYEKAKKLAKLTMRTSSLGALLLLLAALQEIEKV